MASNALVPLEGAEPEWAEIIEKIVDELGDDLAQAELPDQVLQATEMLIAGWPTSKVAKSLDVPQKTIKTWLMRYPSMALAVANGRKLMIKWRMSRLEQQFLQAVDKSEEVLGLDLDDRTVNAKLVGTVAQHARFIIGLFAGQKIDIDINVNQSESTLKAREDALSYLASELARQRQHSSAESELPIEANYTVEDVSQKTPIPLLLESGESPFSKLGELERNEYGLICHACGHSFKSLSIHASIAHKLSAKEYELMYMIPLGTIKAAEAAHE